MDYRKTRRVIKAPKRNVTETASVAAPIKGMNSRDPLAAMDPLYAVSATNFVATPQGLSVRQGYRKHATGMTGLTSSLLVFKGQAGQADKLFAFAGSTLYDVTAPGAAVAITSGLSNAQWEHTTVTTNGGNYLVACNGLDTARYFDGTNWAQFTFSATPNAPGQINTSGTGTPVSQMQNLSNWSQVIVHQRRLWIVQANSTTAYYLPIDSMGGTAVSFDFGPVFPRGGMLKSLASWAVDTNIGIQNYLVAVSTAGDVAIYTGTNPASASTWAHAGTWQLGEPIGTRCLTPYYGDLLYLCQDGLLPMSQYMKSGRTDNAAALSLIIQNDISSQVNVFGSLKGFQVVIYPGNNLLILNVPQINAQSTLQYVYNTITQGWTLFTGWPAQCWAVLNNSIYFGHSGGVARAFVGFRDDAETDGSGGSNYIASAQQAFNYFQMPGVKKRFLEARPNVVTTVASPLVKIGCNVDFDMTQPAGSTTLLSPNGSVWDSGSWDLSTWSNGANTFNKWQGIRGIGFCMSLTISISVTDSTLWTGTDYIFEPGGTLG